MSVLKKFQPIRSSRLAGCREQKYECLVLLYILAEVPGVYPVNRLLIFIAIVPTRGVFRGGAMGAKPPWTNS